VLPVPVKRQLRRAVGHARTVRARLRPTPLPPGALDCVLARNEYGAYCVPRSSIHRAAAKAVLRCRVWEPDTLTLMRSVPGDVVHAGTFFGDFLPALATSGEGLVWAFEPNRENYRCARITTELNGLENVRLTHAALSDTPGEGSLITSDRHGRQSGGGSHLSSEAPEGRDHETVPVVTVDEAVPADRHVGVLQLDVEGHEQQALLGAMLTIERCRPLLILETVPAQDWMEAHLPAYNRSTVLAFGNTALEAS
jgi:FkbM family methyltransferase